MTARAAGLNARITVASVLLALVVMGAFALMVSTIQDLRSSSGAARASEKVIASANRLQNLALDLETGVRGFVVSGNRAFLEPYATAAAEYRGLAHDLEHLVAADPTQFRRARELEAQIRAYHHAWAERVIATAARNPAAARRLIATAAGKARMDAIRIGFARFLRTEQRAAAMHSEHSDDGGRTAILIGLGAVGGTAVLILVYALYLFRVVTAPVRRIAEGARRLADGALTTRVPDGGAGEIAALARDFNAMAESLGNQSAQLREQNAELQAVLDATLDGILMTDVEGTILFSNRKMEQFGGELGLPDDGLIWDRMARLAALTTTPDGYYDAFARMAADPRAEVDAEFELRDTRRSFIGHTAPVEDSNRTFVGRIFSIREVTAERQSERTKDQFVATVSHELRTPLTSILGYTELLLDRGLHDVLTAEDRRMHLEVVRRNADRLQRLVGDLLFFAQVQSSRLPLDLEPVNLASLASGALEAARPVAEDKGVTLSLDVAVPVDVEGDVSRLEQLLDNLVSNAVKFTPAGGLVEVSLRNEVGEAVVSVRDTGIGIPADELERLFTRFFRASTATTREIQGTGLGLAIARTIAEAHGGSIHVSSEPDRGTTFDVRLPLRQAVSASATPALVSRV
ncbi:MAG: CHASE3 domain-containing protein [Acidobacteria bacterium]|nr:CHASE3 domain-containing protein [Acidobacteriota bacterium]